VFSARSFTQGIAVLAVCAALWFLTLPAAAQELAPGAELTIRLPIYEPSRVGQVAAELRELGFFPVEAHTEGAVPYVAIGRFTDHVTAEMALNSLMHEGYVGATLERRSDPIAAEAGASAAPAAALPPAGVMGWPLWLVALVAVGGLALVVFIAWGAAQLTPRRVPPIPARIVNPGPETPLILPTTPRVRAPLPYTPPAGMGPHTPPPLAPSPEEMALRRRQRVARAPVPIFTDGLDQMHPGEAPPGWILPPEELASLNIVDEPDRGITLEFWKTAMGPGALSWCALPECHGEVVIEFDLACHEKNNYLLGLYLQEGQDFRRSIQTQIHNTPSGRPRLRLHGAEAPIAWGEWVRVCYEIDLGSARLAAYLNGERVGEAMELTLAPRHIDCFVIRTAPETIGRLSLSRLRVWSAKDLRAHVVNTPLTV
jgi:hypothetical protein